MFHAASKTTTDVVIHKHGIDDLLFVIWIDGNHTIYSNHLSKENCNRTAEDSMFAMTTCGSKTRYAYKFNQIGQAYLTHLGSIKL